MNNDSDLASGFVDEEAYQQPASDLSSQFIMFSEVDSHGFNRLVKACRDGKWYMLKCLKPEYAQVPVFQEMLRKEYDLQHDLSHPHIAICYGLEEVEGYGRCLVIEYVQGKSLRQFIDEGRYGSVAEYLASARSLVSQIVSAMDYMHARQMVHRDLKPENILIADNGNNVKIIDFSFSDSDAYLVLKQSAGTPRYIAPELYHSSTTDVRADIFSFGVILQELFDDESLGWRRLPYLRIARKCQLPLDKRVPNTAELLRLLDAAGRPLPWKSWLSALLLALIVIVAVILGRHSEAQHYVEGTNIPVSEVDSLTVGYTQEQRARLVHALQLFTTYRETTLIPQLERESEQRLLFVQDFTPDSIMRMTFADYDIENPNGFCLRLRNGMPLYGNLLPYAPSACFGRDLSPEQFEALRSQIALVIGVGYIHDELILSHYMARSPLRQCLLSLYYPSHYLPIVDEQQIEIIVENLLPDIQSRSRYAPGGDVRRSHDLLIGVHDSYSMFSQWSLPEFAYFLTHYFPLSEN